MTPGFQLVNMQEKALKTSENYNFPESGVINV